MDESKRCTRCGAERPRADFPKRSRAKDGLAAWCKPCTREYSQRHYEQNRTKRNAQAAAWYEANRDSRREQIKAYRLAHLDEEREYQRRRAVANPSERARLVREWRAANPERARELARLWRAENAEAERTRARAQYAANPEKFIEQAHRRRALIRGVAVGAVDYEALWTGRCGICDLRMRRDLAYPHPMSKSVDHIIPLALGGTHEQGNLQYAHLRCNVAKGANLA